MKKSESFSANSLVQLDYTKESPVQSDSSTQPVVLENRTTIEPILNANPRQPIFVKPVADLSDVQSQTSATTNKKKRGSRGSPTKVCGKFITY